MTSNLSETKSNPIFRTVGWDHCPAEILFIIFEKLDITSLRCCLSVNRIWKEIAIAICESEGLWQDLAEDGIVNHGVTQRSKSLLSWRDLYLNSLLWSNIELATVTKSYELKRDNIQNIHVFKDNIIVVNTANVEFYNIQSFKCVRVLSISCEDFLESDNMMIVVANNNNNYYKLTIFGKLHNDDDFKTVENHFNGTPCDDACEMRQSWRWLIHNDCCYVIDWKYVLWKIYRINEYWNVKSLAKYYYGGYQYNLDNSMNTIHVLKDEVFVSLKWGDLIQVLKNSFQFRKRIADVPTYVVAGKNVNHRLPYKEGLDKFSAIINVPFDTEYVDSFLGRDKIHYHYDDPEMTCGLQHGEVVFLGYDDGRVEIRLLKKCYHPSKEFNIKEFDPDPIEDPAVTGLEVFEEKNMHRLFVKTNYKLYQVLIQYPDSLLEAEKVC